MRGNYKKAKRTKNQKRDLNNIENIQKLPSTPNYDYMSDQYDYKNYNQDIYKRRNLSSIPTVRSSPKPRSTTRYSQTSAKASIPTPPKGKTKSRQKVKKKKTKFFMGRILFFIIFIIGVIYVISIVIETTQKPVISYQMVQRGIIDNSDVFNGLIVRKEKVISNTKEGNMYLLAAEGDRVRKNGEVYQILDSSESSILERDIQEVESDIEKMQTKRQDISYYQNEIQEINNNISNHIEEYHMLSKAGRLDKTHELKKQIEYEIVKRKNIHMKDSTVALDVLKDQKQDLSSKLSANETIYKSPESGMVSYYIDGFEEAFTFDNIDVISEKDIKQKYVNVSTTTNQIIQKDEPAYKIIQDNQWYLVCFIPEPWAQKFQEGQKHKFTLIEDNNVEVTLKVEENIPQGKQHKIIFSSSEQLELFSTKRTMSFKSLQYIYEGLKIPMSAITERNLIKIPSAYIMDSENGKGVMKRTEDSEGNMFLGLNIQYEDDNGYAHILQNFGQKGTLQLGDTIVGPSNNDDTYTVSEVSTTKGVYVVNGRITKFKQINIIAQNDEYVIVKPNSINGLKQFDQIVTSPKNIQEEQLLRDMDVKNIK